LLPAFCLLGLGLAGCNTVNRLSELGEEPAMTQIKDPTKVPGYRAVEMPTPGPVASTSQYGSIWQSGARAFFKDQRAKRVGDLVTVVVTINDLATLKNQTQGTRGDSDNVAMNNFFGLEKALPSQVDPASLVSTSDARTQNDQSQINRAEQINTRLSAEVSQVLPNGNLVIVGKQEVRVNYEVRELDMTGIVRATDIDSLDEVTYDKIAEARISYSGHGQGTDLQQPRLGQQLIDIISPF
jgi:flagellar L-ring protein precursor FlgH